MRKLLILLFLTSIAVQSQTKYTIDTTYTPKSVYNKEIKNYPFISLVQAREYTNVLEKKEIVYTKINDRELHFDAYYTNRKNPAIVILHGGGWKSGNKSQMETFAKEIASKGFSCFTIEYRLSQEAKYPSGIFDAKKAILFIKINAEKFNADTSKIAILGCSSGGQMAALIGSTNSNSIFENNEANHKITANVQAIVDIDGILAFKHPESKEGAAVQAIVDIDGILAFKHPESKEGAAAGLWLGGSYEEKPEVWQQASALTHIDKNTPPTLFINSSKERFHAGRDHMITILNQYKIYNEVKTFENSPHSFWFLNPWFDETVNTTVHFLNKIFKTN